MRHTHMAKPAPGPEISTTYEAVVGQVLRRHRATLGLRQKALAAALGLSQSGWSRLELGSCALTLTQFARVSVELGISPGRLLEEADRWTSSLQAKGVHVLFDRAESGGNIPLVVGAGLAALIDAWVQN